LNATERAKRALAKRQAAGGRVVRVILSPAAAHALERITAADECSMTQAVEDALLAKSPPTPATDPSGFIAMAKASMG
jgi:hypothetical protein